MIQLGFNVSYRIEAGPSKWDLAAALFEHTREHPRLIKFTLCDNEGERTIVSVILNSIQREDGSGESWNLVCYYVGRGQLAASCVASFSTRDRTGTLSFREVIASAQIGVKAPTSQPEDRS